MLNIIKRKNMAIVGSCWKCDKCGIVFMLVGNPEHTTMNPVKCPQKNCNGIVKKATIGWT